MLGRVDAGSEWVGCKERVANELMYRYRCGGGMVVIGAREGPASLKDCSDGKRASSLGRVEEVEHELGEFESDCVKVPRVSEWKMGASGL